LLTVENIHISYGETPVIRGISFQVEKNQIVSIIGGNGAGKTTTLKGILGLLALQQGTVFFQGQDLTNSPTHLIVERGISLVPEGRQVFPNMTVLENLLMGSYIKGARKDRPRLMQWVNELFPIFPDRKDQLAGSLSGGEQQMLAIGRALMSKPSILFMDEPSLGLAPLIVESMFKIISQIKDSGTPILLVEQNVYYALSIADWAYVLENGAIVLNGEGRVLLESEDIQKAYLGL
jgi:branched-chain amino acid transport system ATP-binding protein